MSMNHEDKLNDEIEELEKENAELRAHYELEPYFTSGNSIDAERAMIPKTILSSLPPPAKHNAEIIRCADSIYSIKHLLEEYRCEGRSVVGTDFVGDLISAVRAARDDK